MVVSGVAEQQQQELISFYIADQHFCIDIMTVREIRGWTSATPLPHAPATSRGVVNLRGAILPIVDLGALLGLSAMVTTKQHVIIVVESAGQVVGLLVDGVSDILTVGMEMIQEAPSIAAGSSNTKVAGIVEIEGRLMTLLAVGSLVSELLTEAAA